MLVAATAAVGAFAAAIPADAAVASHANPAITSAAASASAATAAPDGPYPVAYDELTLYLTDDPNTGLPEVCTGLYIYLTAGVYEWDGFIGSSYPHTFDVDVYLASGDYDWYDCLTPENGYYYQSSVICPETLGPSYPCVDQHVYPELASSGTYTFGSWLDWLYL